MKNELWIYGVIGKDMWGDGLSPEKVRDDLAALDPSEDLLVRINSPGGDVFDGASIYTLISEWPKNIDVMIDGVAASCGSYIGTLGRKVIMSQGAMIMIHNPWTIAAGNAFELRKEAGLLDKITENLQAAYINKSGRNAAEIKAALDAETWFTGREAIEFGLADEVTEQRAKAIVIPDDFEYKNAPKPKQPERNRMSVAAMRRKLSLTKASLPR